jgi:hypothetical protein
MSLPVARLPRSNPFATRRIRPGAVPFFFAPGESVATLVERLEAHHGWGQIIGPHGTGKSTLLAAFLAELRRWGKSPRLVEFHAGQRRKWQTVRQALAEPDTFLLVVDGFEQLRFWSRYALKAICHRRGMGLVVTAHRSVGLPDLYRTEGTPAQAWQVVQYLLAGEEKKLIEADDLRHCLAARKGNLREALFDLYDLYEQRRPWIGYESLHPFVPKQTS